MRFLHPGVLWWLPLALLPLVLHLLGRRRRRERPFPWVWLLAQAQHQGRYRSRPVEWLVLFLRMLALALALLALAGPRWGALPVIRTVALDASGSMYRPGTSLTRMLPQLRLWWPEARWVTFADRILPRYQRTDLATRYAVLRSLPGPVLVLTDGQASGFVGLHRSPIPWVVVLLGDSQRPNVQVEALTALSPYTLKGFPLRVRVRLRNFGDQPARRILTLEGREALHRQVEIPAKGEWETDLQVVPDAEGHVQATLRPADDFPCDDHRDLVVQTVGRQDLAWVGSSSPVLQALVQPEGTPALFRVHRFPRVPNPAQLAPYSVVLFYGVSAPGPSFRSWLLHTRQRILIFDTTGTWARLLGLQADPPQNLRVDGEALRATPLTGSGHIQVQSDEGRAVVVEQGRVVLFGLDPDRAGPWVLTPAFVRLFYRLAVANADGITLANGVKAGTPWILPLPENTSPPYLLQGAGESRILSPSEHEGRPALRLTLLRAGYYRILAGTDTLARLTVVCPAEESDPVRASREQWQQVMAPGSRVLSWEELAASRPVDLRPGLLVAALLALALEAVLLRWK